MDEIKDCCKDNELKKNNKSNKFGWIFFIILIVAIVFYLFRGSITGGIIGVDKDVVEIPLSEITEQAQFYNYNGIKYFVVKASNGDIKTAFDACDVCYSSKKGYRQEGDYMVCNNCGNKYPISGLGTKNLQGGGCWPGYLPSKIKGENLIIKESDLNKGRDRFR